MTTNNFAISFNGLTIDYANPQKYKINAIQGLTGIPINTIGSNLINTDGGAIYRQKYTPRNINISLKIVEDSPEDLFSALQELNNAYSKTDEDVSFVITRWDDASTQRSLDVRVIQEPSPPLLAGLTTVTDRFNIQLQASNPFFRDATTTSYSTSPGVSAGGFMPGTAPFSMGTGTSGTINIQNTGDVSTYPDLIRFNGQVSNPVLTNVSTGKFLRLSTTINTGDYIDVYRQNNQLFVLKNGTTNMFSVKGGDFFELQKGANTLAYQVSSGTGTVTVNYRNQYRTI